MNTTESTRPNPSADRASGETTQSGQSAQNIANGQSTPRSPFSEKDEKALFLNVTVGIVLLELAVTVGAVVYSIANATRTAPGMVRFNFPWIGYLVTVTLVPVLVMLVLHLVSLGFSRTLGRDNADTCGQPDAEAVLGNRAAKFYALVRGAPTVILFAGFVLMGAAVYYLDGVMALLLKLGDSFQTVAIWGIGALGVAFCVNAVARAVLAYKTRQLEEEYAFRREVFERTGTILMSSRQIALPPQNGPSSLPPALPAALPLAESIQDVEVVATVVDNTNASVTEDDAPGLSEKTSDAKTAGR